MGARAAERSSDPLVIYRSVNRDGETFALETRSLQRLQQQLGSLVHARPRVFIAHETKADYEHVQGPIAQLIIQLLTGLAEERLHDLGGVTFQDAATQREVPRA